MFDNVDWGATILTLVVAFIGSGVISTLILKKHEKDLAVAKEMFDLKLTEIKAKSESNLYVSKLSFDIELKAIVNVWEMYIKFKSEFMAMYAKCDSIKKSRESLTASCEKFEEWIIILQNNMIFINTDVCNALTSLKMDNEKLILKIFSCDDKDIIKENIEIVKLSEVRTSTIIKRYIFSLKIV